MVVGDKFTNFEDDTSDIEEVVELSEEIAKQFKKYEYSSRYNLNSEELFCICRRPDDGELMIMCDGCEEWFHFKCMHLNKLYSNLVSKFYCKFCKWKGTGTTKWKRKCRLPRCYEPIMPNSKYCSVEHGKLFMKQLLVERPRSRNDLSINVINDVISHVNQDHEKLLQLGTVFPQLEQVTQFINNGTGDMPQDIKDKILLINQKLEKVQSGIGSFNKKCQLLVDIKDKIKLLNDKLTMSITSEESKKSKLKKIDLCYYDRNLDKSDESIMQSFDNKEAFDELKLVIETRISEENISQEWFKEQMCIQDRKRCVRHNGWWNLINDEISKNKSQLERELEKLQGEKDQVFKDYCISIYEADS